MNQQLGKVQLLEEAVKLGLGAFSAKGAFVVETGKHTGRATQERFIVKRPEIEKDINWGKTNASVDPEFSDKLFAKVEEKLNAGKSYYTKKYVSGLSVEVTSTSPWHIAFAQNMFRDTPVKSVADVVKDKWSIKIYHDPYGKISDYGLTAATETMICVDPHLLKVVIVGTAYAGEIKKSAFTLCNFKLPELGFLPMHASANTMEDGTNSCVLFGLSGTGKTTLSATSDRALIGDDEIVWTPAGLTNLEGGCYAKLIDLTVQTEPEIFAAVNQFGAIMENVGMDKETREVDFTNRTRTENTRGSYPLTALNKFFNQNVEAKAPKSIIFLTADAFGALPAVAKLNSYEAQYHFISGYTARVAGTEMGVKEPQATFSTCFGAPFMPRFSSVYAKLLADYAQKVGATFWLVNTGWTGGGYGKGQRFPIAVSRKIVASIQSGELAKGPFTKHPIFGFEVPTKCAGVEDKHLAIPQNDEVKRVAALFIENMKNFTSQVDSKVVFEGGPKL